MNILNGIWTMINSSATNVLIFILTVLSIFELLDMYGINVKLFSYSKRKREKERRQIEKVVDEYVDNNKNLFKSNANEYINYILTSMGIKNGQTDKLFSAISELKKANAIIKTNADMDDMIKSLLIDSRIVLDLSKLNPDRKVIYSGLKYYIDLTDTMNIKSVNTRVLSILYYYIETMLLGQNLSIRNIDRLVIPTESNIILGIELADLFDVEPIIMHNKRRRIYDDQYWDGTLTSGNRLLIIHDVIYSGDNIVDCIHHLPKSCSIIGVVSLVNRTDKKISKKIGKRLIEETGIRVYSAIDVDDDFLDNLRKECDN